MRWSVCALTVLTAGILWIAASRLSTSANDQVSTIPDTLPDTSVEVSGPLMQAKLVMTQRVLEGILSHDFDTIQSSAQGLSRLAEASASADADDRIFEHFRTEFVRLSLQLESLAKDENLEGAAYAHQNLTATCIACHTHVRDASRP